MSIDVKKINALRNSRVDQFYQDKVRSKLEQNKVPILQEKQLSLTRLYDKNYWSELKAVNVNYFGVLDHRHWHYDDGVFEEYIKKIVSVHFPVLRLFESPYGYEISSIDVDAFSKKLFERTERLFKAVKSAGSKTIILSPAIGIIPKKYTEKYLDYLIHNRHYFDGYSLHICNDMSEHTLGRLNAALTQIMNVMPKKVWVTKWAVPSFEGPISNTVLGPSSWKPLNYKQAIQRLRRSFSVIEAGATAGSVWFYTGLLRDIYKPRRKPGPHEVWEFAEPGFVPAEYNYAWDFWHFLGMGTVDGVVKETVFNSFIQLATERNS